MNDSFVAGLLVGLFTGGLIGALGMAVVAAGSGRRFPEDLRKVPFDCSDPRGLAEFWATALSYVIEAPNEAAGEVLLMDPTGVGPSLGFMKVPESKTVKNRVHLDLTTETSLEEEVERLVAAGARIVTTLQDPNEGYVDPHIWTVMQDPEGNEFCVLEPLNRRPASERGAAPCSVQRSPVLLKARKQHGQLPQHAC